MEEEVAIYIDELFDLMVEELSHEENVLLELHQLMSSHDGGAEKFLALARFFKGCQDKRQLRKIDAELDASVTNFAIAKKHLRMLLHEREMKLIARTYMIGDK